MKRKFQERFVNELRSQNALRSFCAAEHRLRPFKAALRSLCRPRPACCSTECSASRTRQEEETLVSGETLLGHGRGERNGLWK